MNVTLQVPDHIWKIVVQKFPSAQRYPQEILLFLLGLAMGTWSEQQRREELRRKEAGESSGE